MNERPEIKFIQITATTGPDETWCLFALDMKGRVWKRTSETWWKLMPSPTEAEE